MISDSIHVSTTSHQWPMSKSRSGRMRREMRKYRMHAGATRRNARMTIRMKMYSEREFPTNMLILGYGQSLRCCIWSFVCWYVHSGRGVVIQGESRLQAVPLWPKICRRTSPAFNVHCLPTVVPPQSGSVLCLTTLSHFGDYVGLCASDGVRRVVELKRAGCQRFREKRDKRHRCVWTRESLEELHGGTHHQRSSGNQLLLRLRLAS